MGNREAVGAGPRRLPLKVAILCLLLALAFVAGAVVRGLRTKHIPGSGWLPSHLPFIAAGNLGPGTYYIPYGRKGQNVILRIVAKHHGKGVRAVQLDDGYPGNDFALDWQRFSHFGVPIVSMVAGRKRQGCWIDVGLRGRLFIKGGAGDGHGLTRLRGKWVKWAEGGPNHLIVKGVTYAYDQQTGRWKELAANTGGGGG